MMDPRTRITMFILGLFVLGSIMGGLQFYLMSYAGQHVLVVFEHHAPHLGAQGFHGHPRRDNHDDCLLSRLSRRFGL